MAITVWGYHLFSGYYMLSTLHLILYSLKKKITGDIIIPILETRKQRFRDVQY